MWRDEEEQAGRTFCSTPGLLFRDRRWRAVALEQLFITLWRVIYYRQSKRLLRPRSVAAAAGDDRNHLFCRSHNDVFHTSQTVHPEQNAQRWRWWRAGAALSDDVAINRSSLEKPDTVRQTLNENQSQWTSSLFVYKGISLCAAPAVSRVSPKHQGALYFCPTVSENIDYVNKQVLTRREQGSRAAGVCPPKYCNCL